MSDGDMQTYDLVRQKNVMEFWHMFDMWKDKLTKDTKRLKKNGRI